MRRRIVQAGVAVAALGGLLAAAPVSAMQLTPAQEALYTSVSILPPSASAMTVCYGFVCRRREMLNFSAGDRAALARIMAGGHGSAAAERAAAQKAVVWFDRRIGPVIGTNKRVADADIRALDSAHNFDCWDTTRNVTSLLLVMQEWGLFKFHTVSDPHYRGNPLALQLPHNTAVLKERASGTEWVLDMWTTPYGHVPDLMPLAEWVKRD